MKDFNALYSFFLFRPDWYSTPLGLVVSALRRPDTHGGMLYTDWCCFTLRSCKCIILAVLRLLYQVPGSFSSFAWFVLVDFRLVCRLPFAYMISAIMYHGLEPAPDHGVDQVNGQRAGVCSSDWYSCHLEAPTEFSFCFYCFPVFL